MDTRFAMDVGDIVAAYAAVVATIVLVWDVIKWLRSGARLKGHASINMKRFFPDGRIDERENLIVLAVRNVGDAPTAITNVGLVGRSRWGKHRWGAVVPQPSFSGPLPFTLEVGQQWLGIVQQDAELESKTRESFDCTRKFTTPTPTSRGGFVYDPSDSQAGKPIAEEEAL
jgi:hypothetical protein